MQDDPALFVRVVDFALQNITFGYQVNECEGRAKELDRFLRETGAVWEVREVPNRLDFSLARRMDTTTSAVLDSLATEGADDARHLTEARKYVFGEKPQPDKAYDEAVKAVEAASIPVVLPKDSTATLGKVIRTMRDSPTKWSCTFSEPTAKGQSPVEVVIAMMDLLWKNDTDRHALSCRRSPRRRPSRRCTLR
jgi:hypothetical protein